MSTYFIGDIHGCYQNLKVILNRIHFNPNLDTLNATGDLVSRGPNSLEVLRLMYSLKKKARTVLGNHDLNLLKEYFYRKNQKKSKNSTFDSILHAPDADKLIDWLKRQPMVYIDKNKKILMSHAGIYPDWNIDQVQEYANEIEKILTSKNPSIIFQKNFTNINNKNYSHINQIKKIQENINKFTKMRCIDKNKKLNMQYKDSPKNAPDGIHPWFNFPNLITPKYNIIFGHWASLQNTKIPDKIYALDSGCCWGNKLTVLKWENKEVINVLCDPPA